MENRLQVAKETLESFLIDAGFVFGITFASPTTARAAEQYITPKVNELMKRHEWAGFVGSFFGVMPAFILVGSAVMSLNPLYALPVAVSQGASLAAEVINDKYFSGEQNAKVSM